MQEVSREDIARRLSYSSSISRRSRLGLILSVIFATILVFGTVIAMSVGWALQIEEEANANVTSTYKSFFVYYPDLNCSGFAISEPVGPCWYGEGAGYEGYYWQYSCDEEFKIYEAMCRAADGCSECRARFWGEYADTCYEYLGEFYEYTCVKLAE
eukprot:TRINITY_DN1155_c0_g1_i1.p1 TRINITY_DN1155_c0_g1~~TRINITY_DN1155_c0_g1_i1.p1  ORF type:complete len:156 (-),score=14.68 TRINITY_DN1155_c0_g1_i1:39-506(-)